LTWTRGWPLLLQNLKRYEAALLRIAEKPEEQKVLMEHRETTGQEVPASDLQRWFAYLDVAHMASEALSHGDPVAAPESSDKGR